MKISIETNICEKLGLSINEVLYLLLVKNENNIENVKYSLLQKQAIVDINNQYLITQEWDDLVQKILLESDKEIPKTDNLEDLVINLRELFPKGFKTSSIAWRGNKREISLRLQKFFKIYDNKYTYEQIYNATKRYVDSFQGNYTYMRILKYFILKDDIKIDEEGKRYVEQVSELANYLENTENTDNSDWLLDLK